MVDENRVEGAVKNVAGKLQGAVGEVTGDSETQARGKANQVAGTAQNTFGSVMDVASDWGDSIAKVTKDRPLTALITAVSVGFVLRMLTRRSRR